MIRVATELPGVFVLEPTIHRDERGCFMELFHRPRLAELGVSLDIAQQNLSRSSRNVLRGLHYQLARPQAKLVRVAQGEVFDVAVDVRRGSPTFGRWVGHTLSQDNRRMMFVPIGFAHGFLALSDHAEVVYACSDVWAPNTERGLRWDDPTLAIAWPLAAGERPIVSGKDAVLPRLDDILAGDLPPYDVAAGDD